VVAWDEMGLETGSKCRTYIAAMRGVRPLHWALLRNPR